MSLQIELKKSAVSQKQPFPSDLALGEIALNYNADGPFLTCKDTAGNIRKLSGIWVGASAPSSPTAGDPWLDTSSTPVLKIYNGSTWVSAVSVSPATTSVYGTVRLATAADITNGTAGKVVDAAQLASRITADITAALAADPFAVPTLNVTGNATINGNLVVDGTITADLTGNADTATALSSNRTFAVTGDVTGTVSSDLTSGASIATSIASGVIVDGDVNASAAIAGTKIDPDFGSQTVETTGVFSAAGGAEATPSIAFTGDLDTGIYSPGADQVAISTNGTGRLFVDSSGNVGIDSSGPAAKLDVNGDGGASLPAISAGTAGIARRTATAVSFCAFSIIAGTASSSRLNFGNTDDEDTGRIQYLHTDNSFQVFTNATEKLRITSDGKLGLGTSSPSEQLELGSGNIKLANVGRIFSADGTRGSVQISAPNDNTSRRVTYGNNYYLDSDGTYKQDATNIGGSLIEMTATNSDYGIFKVIQKQDPDIGGATREALVVDTSGNVGIGTTSPNANLHVNSPGNTILELSSTFSNSPTTGIIIDTIGDSSTARIVFQKAGVNRGTIRFSHNAVGGNEQLSFNVGGGAEELVITGAGNVGIGTTSPSSLLHLADAGDITVGTTTGTKIGTATSQKIGFYNATPVVQPTTSVAEAAFVENSGGTAVNVDSTFGGYTIQQVVEALQTLGLLA